MTDSTSEDNVQHFKDFDRILRECSQINKRLLDADLRDCIQRKDEEAFVNILYAEFPYTVVNLKGIIKIAMVDGTIDERQLSFMVSKIANLGSRVITKEADKQLKEESIGEIRRISKKYAPHLEIEKELDGGLYERMQSAQKKLKREGVL